MKSLCSGIFALLFSGGALAAPVTFNLNYSLVSGTGSASGTFTIDDSNLAPNVVLGSASDLNGLLGFQLTVSGLTTTPGSTSFDLSDLDSWLFTTNASGDITDVNFFMDSPNVNADGYAIRGVEPFVLAIFDGAAFSGPTLAAFEASPQRQPDAPIPATSAWAMASLALLLALFGWRRSARRA